MDCKKVEKLIPLFQEDNLTIRELQDFVNHIEHCKECKEELSIYYLIYEGMLRLEDGNAFDLKKELNMYLEKAHAKLQVRRGLQLASYCMEGMVVIAIVILLALIAL